MDTVLLVKRTTFIQREYSKVSTKTANRINNVRGGLPYESDGDARRKIIINTLKETNLGVAPALFNP